MRKQYIAFALTGVLALGAVGCGQQQQAQTETKTEQKAETKTEQTESKTTWSEDKDAEAAAKGAGLDKFSCFEKVTFNDTDYKDPKFAHAQGVAQAVYEPAATKLTLREGASGHKAPLTDLDKTELAQKWTKSIDGIDVTHYGPKEGAAVVITWSDGGSDFGVTYEGTGGEQPTLDDEDVSAIVHAVKDASEDKKDDDEKKDEEKKTEEKKTEEKKSDNSQKQSTDNNNNGNNNSNNNSGTSNSNDSDDSMIPRYTKEECMQAAYSYAGAGGGAKGPANNTSIEGPIEGGGTTYYNVDFDLGYVHYHIMVDALSGSVVSGDQTFNGTTQLLDDNGDPIEGTETPAE